MLPIRRLLLEIRKIHGKTNKKFYFITLLSSLLLLSLGFAIDHYFVFNFYSNTIRAIIALLSSITLFAFFYITANKISDKLQKERNGYRPLRKQFSYKQRKNFGVLWGGLILLQIIVLTRQNLFFTLMSSLQLLQILTILSFVRESKSEYIKNSLGIPEFRDFMTDKEVQKRIQERRKERNRSED